MSFRVNVAGVAELSGGRLATEAVIERSVYNHAHAVFIIEWDELNVYSAQTVATIAAKTLNATVEVEWNGNNEQEHIPCFHGYVECATGDRVSGQTYLKLECVSFSKRTDLVPRYRVFQACTLQSICQQILRTEPLIRVIRSADLNFDVALSVQNGETDFAYLRRMLGAWGIPMSIMPRTGEVALGARGTAGAAFPDTDASWDSISFVGATAFYEKPVTSGSGAGALVLSKVAELNSQLNPRANDYYSLPDAKTRRVQFSQEHSQANPATYRVVLRNNIINFVPGQIVTFENSPHIIRSVVLRNHDRTRELTQEFELQQYCLPYEAHFEMPKWSSYTLWGHVTANENDPLQQGRIQVKFEFEDLDPPASANRAWLPTLTLYGGGKNPQQDKASSYSGLYSLPEVGERVLIGFTGDWDSEAVILGTVRESPVDPKFSARDSKRWRTPSGNEIVMTTSGADDVVRIRCKDKIFFEARMSGPTAEVMITPGESDADIIHFKKGAGPSQLNILSDGNITVVAKQALHLEGMTVQVKASGGPVNIDGSPMVLINTAPTPATPLVRQPFVEQPPHPASAPALRQPTPPTPD